MTNQSVAIVTGASQGIGRATALRLARDFVVVVLVARNDAQWEDGMALKFHGARRLTMRAWDALKASNGS
jgi:3-oxoacyl-[acyl-carrier protein] reductase